MNYEILRALRGRDFLTDQDYTQEELLALLELAGSVEHPYSVGEAIAHSGVLTSHQEEELLSSGLGSDNPAWRDMALGFLTAARMVKGAAWLDNVRSGEPWRGWNPRQRADYYLCLPFSKETWDLLQTEEPVTQRQYWSNVPIFGRGSLCADDCELAAVKLLECGRWPDAIQLLAIYVNRVRLSPELVARVLEHAVRGTDVETVNWGLLSLDVAELVKYLQDCGELGEVRLAQLEWYFLPFLREPGYSPSLLHKALADDPEFFVGVLKLVYRSEAEEPSNYPTDQQEAMARRGYDLLHGWRVPPGVKEDGSVDPEKLHAWVTKARELLRASGRSKIGDYQIGQILAHYPAGSDGAWPHEAVRDLLEELASDEIDQGIHIGVRNKRGTVTRSIGEGGAQERAIAQRYRNYSEAVRDRWPRVGRILAGLATAYEAEARWEDIQDELHEDTWG